MSCRNAKHASLSAAILLVALPAPACGIRFRKLMIVPLAAILIWSLLGGAHAQERRHRVLLLYPYNNLFPTNVQTGDAVIQRLTAGASAKLELYTDFLDLGRFSGEAYERQTADALAAKYRGRPPDVVITLGPQALLFLTRNRPRLQFEAPVVFCCTSNARLSSLTLQPRDTGIISEFDVAQTMRLARALQPNSKEIVLLAGASEFDKTSAAIARRRLSVFEKDYKITELVGLRHADLIDKLGRLSPDTIVFLMTMFTDADGRLYITPDLLPELSRASTSPIYTPYEAYLGRGVIGGYSDSLEQMGADVADLALDLLAGADAEKLRPRPSAAGADRVDWRELRRWNMDESHLPPGTEVRYREYSVWELYRGRIITILALIVLQAAIITALIVERRRRRIAEADLRKRLLQVIHLNRSAVAGALSASVAHELNQPLGAIRSYAEAASIYLKANPPDLKRVEKILGNIRDDDKRAADIIVHLRGLLKRKDDVDLEQFDINDVVRDAIQIVRPDALKRGITVDLQQSDHRLEVLGDRIQVQQVILNLVMNGLDAMQDCPTGSGKIAVQTAVADTSTAEVSVLDSGTGIVANKLRDVFDAFYTTKKHGTGLGLAIARTIVETYGGKIWAENRPTGGAAFRFTLPLSTMVAI